VKRILYTLGRRWIVSPETGREIDEIHRRQRVFERKVWLFETGCKVICGVVIAAATIWLLWPILLLFDD